MSDLALISPEEAAELRGHYRELCGKEELLKSMLERIREEKRHIAEKVLLGGQSEFLKEHQVSPTTSNNGQPKNRSTRS